MNIAVLFIISSAATLGCKIFSKLCSNSVVGRNRARYPLFLIVNGFVACLFFLIAGGFKLSYNFITLAYSLIYAIVVAVILISTLMVYKFATIAGVNIISSAFNLAGSLVIGYLVFDENIDIRSVLRVIVMLIAVTLVFFDTKNTSKDSQGVAEEAEQKNKTLKLVLALSVMILGGLSNIVITKFFAISLSVTDENSFFFLTNGIICLGAFAIFAFECFKEREAFLDSIKLLKPLRLVSLSGNTVCSNIGSLVGIWIIAQMDVSLYTPISSALGIIIGVIGSLLFRERLGAFSYIAAAVACVAVII